ncbi:MAG: hypothetical protein CMI16_13500 [Opitutaceae bacterium]|nr:hypothetical protein [Opitutaceae bacterium]
MLLNIVLLVVVFGATTKKFNPYVSAVILGVIKGVILYFQTQNILYGIINFILAGSLAAGFVYFLHRLDKREETEDPYPKYGTQKKGPACTNTMAGLISCVDLRENQVRLSTEPSGGVCMYSCDSIRTGCRVRASIFSSLFIRARVGSD